MDKKEIKLKELRFGLCPFRKIKRKFNDSITNDEVVEEDFKKCSGFDCMAFRYNKIGSIEMINCLRLKINEEKEEEVYGSDKI